MFFKILLFLLLQLAIRAQNDSSDSTVNSTLPGNDNSTVSLDGNSTITSTLDGSVQIDPTTVENGNDTSATSRMRRHEGAHGRKKKHSRRRRRFHTREWNRHVNDTTEESESVWDTIKHAGMDERASNKTQSPVDNNSTNLSPDYTNSTTTQSNSTQILEPTAPTDSKSHNFDASNDFTFINSTHNLSGNSTSDL